MGALISLFERVVSSSAHKLGQPCRAFTCQVLQEESGRYTYSTYSTNSIPRTRKTERKYGTTREPEIDHKLEVPEARKREQKQQAKKT